MKISVIIPSYNSGLYLPATLATIARQDHAPFEVLLIDGNSTDNTREVARTYSSLITTFISEPDRGQLDALQKGIRLAKGDILYWLNADDIVMPRAFSTVAATFQKFPETEIVFSDDYAFDESKRQLSVGETIKGLTFEDHFLFYRQYYSECVFWKRDISDQALPIDPSYRSCTDYSFFLPLRRGRVERWIPQRLGAFRIAPNQMSAKFREGVTQERDRIRANMRTILGMSEEEFVALQKKNALGFKVRQRFIPRAKSGLRYIGRRLTGDRRRRRMADFFFDEWLNPTSKSLQIPHS